MENSGFILINKEKGWTSFDVVAKLRNITRVKKIGHAGTLDPMAQGLLIVAVGRQATKRIHEFQKLDKEYETEIRLDGVSDTYDAEGKIEPVRVDKRPGFQMVKKCVQGFIGDTMQMPPLFSAKKINGQPAYKLARKGKKVELKPVKITIHDIEIVDYEWPFLQLKIKCSKGTYIRSIAHDLGQKLGVGGYLTYLKRTKIGAFDVNNATKITDINQDNWTESLFDQGA